MNNSKKINVSYSSLVGLKAELLRKQAEVEEARSKNKPQPPITLKSKVKNKTSKNGTSKPEQSSKTKTSKVTEIEDVNDLRKSRYMLEAKTKLYEKLKKTHGDRSHNYLVDFSNKPISSSSSSEDEIYNEDDYEDRNSDPEDDWVEYSDCFGRTRKCLRRDLAKMQEKDKRVEKEISKEPPQERAPSPKPPPFIPPPSEPEIEKLRKKWEQQTEELSHKPDIHYQDILFDEARAHGVGYYAFSHDEAERLKQQENLSKLRKETEMQQKEVQNVKELKAQIEKNRLKNARIRQRIRAGLPAEPEDDEEEKADSVSTTNPSEPSDASIDPEKSPKTEEKTEGNSLCIIEDKIKAFGELLRKRPKFRELSQEEWVHKRRKDRMGEFAPVYENFTPGGLLKGTRDNQIVKAGDDDEDPVGIRAGGPEPTDLWECQGPGGGASVEKRSKKTNSKAKSGDEHEKVDSPGGNDGVEDCDIIGPVPPPEFMNSESSSLINNSNLLCPTGNLLSSSSVIDQSLTIIPPIEILKSVPPPTFKSTFSACNFGQTNTQWCAESAAIEPDDDESEESEDSDIIGPMPPKDDRSDENLTYIPLPEEPQRSPPPSAQPGNLNIDKIAEGLKFLRKKYDKCEES